MNSNHQFNGSVEPLSITPAEDNKANDRHTDEIEDIITKVPGWMVRWGIIVIALVLVSVFALASITSYPEVLTVPVTLQNDPSNKGFFAAAYISQENFYKVKTGEPVRLRLRVYPSEQFGFISGEVYAVSEQPDAKGWFEVKIKINPNIGGHDIKLSNWMTGRGEIVIQNTTILKRMLKSVVKI